MVPDGRNFPSKATRLQLIDSDQQFSPDLPHFMDQKWQLTDHGFDYHVIAVFGSQSTGKSTLLNRLFGTRFDIMQESQRQQTTRGIWADRSHHLPNLVILDVEGTDGRERGEDQEFERKSALFSLAVSEVLLVNMWENQVGLYNGANMGLLKTVMEVNLGLFGEQKRQKTLLYFVIRDHVSSATLESLAKTLRTDMEGIWQGLNKPETLKDAQLRDFFDLKFVSLPHKLLQPAEFETEARGLQGEFRSTKEGGVLAPVYKRQVPADGFPHYAQTVWEKVVSNKDLDLPTQQELLAQFRCDEIAAQVVGPFRAAVEKLKPRVEEGQVMGELGEVTQGARSRALDEFDGQAGRYNREVYKKKRQALVDQLDGELRTVYLNQIKNGLGQAADGFVRQSARMLEQAEGPFAETVGRVRDKVMKNFKVLVESLTIREAGWGFEGEVRRLEARLDGETDKLRQREMERCVEKLRKHARVELAEGVVSEQLNQADNSELWEKVMEGFKEEVKRADQKLKQQMKLTGWADREAQMELLRQMHRGMWEDLVAVLRDEAADQMVLLKLRNALEDRFRYDEQGLPRVWKPTDDIDSQFSQAREAAQALLPRLSRMDISQCLLVSDPERRKEFVGGSYELDATLVLISSGRQRELAKRFGREADALYLEAKRAMVATQNRVPVWVLVLLVLLGWNEAMAVLFNPLYLVVVAIVGGAAFVVHNLGLWGPVLHAANGAAGVANQRVHQMLVEAVNRTEPEPVRRRKSSRRKEEIEMEPINRE